MELGQKREAWNKGKRVGQKPPLKPKDIWAAVRYVGIEVDDALEISGQTEI